MNHTPRTLTCRVCKQGSMQTVEQDHVYHPPGGDVTVRTLAAKCDHCGYENVLPSQMAENIIRRSDRKSAYGAYLLGEDIFSFRRKYGLTQQAASKIFGKGKIAFSRYETEASFPDPSTTKLFKMAMKHPQVLKDLADEAHVEIPLWAERCEDERAAKVFPLRQIVEASIQFSAAMPEADGSSFNSSVVRKGDVFCAASSMTSDLTTNEALQRETACG